MQKAQGPGVCKLPKPPTSRALCQAKRAPRAALPSGCLAAQTKRWAKLAQARAASRPGLCAIAPGRRAGAPPLWQLARSFPVTGLQPLSSLRRAGNWASLVAQMVKNLPPMFDPSVRKIPWRREWQSTPVLLSGEFHGQRSLEGNISWVLKELDSM